jgi:hypothetical protein
MSSTEEQVRKKLKQVKDLFDDGFITESEFDKIRKKILSDFLEVPQRKKKKKKLILGDSPKEISKNVRLLIRLPQSGKTEIMLNDIVDFVQKFYKPLVIVICDNSLLLTTQTLSRGNEKIHVKVGKITCDAKGYCEWKKYKGELDKPGDSSEGHRLSERIRDGEVNTIVVCSNKTRWTDIKNIIDEYKTEYNIQLWIDEADKTIGGIDNTPTSTKEKISNINKWKTEIHSINLITATPFTPKYKWSSFKWIGEQLGGVVELLKIPEVTGEGYHHLYNSNWVNQDNSPFENVQDYAEAYLENNSPKKGEIWLIPGETVQESHEQIKNMCLKYFDYIIIINGNNKTISEHDEESNEVILYNLRERQCELLPRKKEMSEWLSEFYKNNQCSDKTIAITGNLCISRGITISSKTCQVSHLIFGCGGTLREEEQLMSRVCGYCYTDNYVPTVVCPQKVWENVSKYQEVIIEISKQAMLESKEEREFNEEKLNSIIQRCNGIVNDIHISEPFSPDKDIQMYILEERGFKNAGILVRDKCGGNLGDDGYMYPKRKIQGHECNVPGHTILTEEVYTNRFTKKGKGSLINRRPHECDGQSFMVYPVYKNLQSDPTDFKYFVHTLIVNN